MTQVANRGDVANASAIFTRGAMDAPDLRGDSMVTKHLEKLQQEKEKNSFAMIQALHADVGPTICALSLEETSWDVDAASTILKRFKAENEDKLRKLMKRRQELTIAQTRPGGKAATANVALDSDNRAFRKHRRQETTTDSHSKKHKSSKHQKEAAPQVKIAGHVASDEYGQHGIIREGDMAAKFSEFQQWAIDVKKANVEALPKWKEKEMFAEYMEDYNTGTLPHKKYYDLDAYARQKALKAAKKGKSAAGSEKTLFNDEEERRREIAVMRATDQEDRLRQAYNELKYTAPDKAADMREQDMLRMQMQMAYRTGDHDTANKLNERLKPDDQKEVRRFDD